MKHFSLFSRSTVIGLLMFFILGISQAFAGEVTIKVKKHNGNALEGVTIQYHDGYWRDFGTTDASGEATKTLDDKTYSIKATYDGTNVTQSVVVSGETEATFYTTAVVACVFTSDATNNMHGIDGVSIQHHSGYWRTFGTTQSGSTYTGRIYKELFCGSRSFKATYDGTTAEQTVTIAGDGATSGQRTEVNFYTTAVVFTVNNYNGSAQINDVDIQFHAGYWRTFGTTHDGPTYDGKVGRQLFPGTRNFKAIYDGTWDVKEVDVPGDGATSGERIEYDFYASAVVVSIYKYDNDQTVGFNGIPVKYHAGYWRTFGTTHDGPDYDGKVGKPLFKNGCSKIKAEYDGTSIEKTITVPSGDNESARRLDVNLYMTTVVFTVLPHDGSYPNGINGVQIQYHSGYWRTLGTTHDGPGYDGKVGKPMFPGSYSFKASYNGTTFQKTYDIPEFTTQANRHDITLYTTGVTVEVEGCDGTPVQGTQCQYHSGYWRTIGNTDANGTTTMERFPGSFNFKANYNGTSSQKNEAIGGNGETSNQTTTISFNPTKLDWVFDGTIRYRAGYWRTVNCPDFIFPGTYQFKFGTFQQDITINDCQVGNQATQSQSSLSLSGNLHIFKTLDSDGNPMPNMNIQRNDYGSHYVSVGTTGNDGILVTTTLPDGSWRFRVIKNYSSQYITSGPDLITFQTSKYVAHVKHTDGSDFAGIETEYNDYGSHWIDLDQQYTGADGKASIELFPGDYNFRAKKNYSVQTKSLAISNSGDVGTVEFQTATYTAHVKHTDGTDFEGIETEYNDYGSHWIDLDPQYTGTDGKASIELFPGDYNFRAKKNYSVQTKSLAISNSGVNETVEFQTSTYTAHVKMQNGSDFAGIETEYNDYGSHWIDLDPQNTGADGKASIELFPGNFKFRAKKNYSVQENMLEITSSGQTDEVDFQTALAVGFVRDCDLNQGVAGIQLEYNDYGSHWIDLNPQNTGADGKASIELFPGTFNLKAKNIYTSEVKPITLANSGDVTQVEFNPTRVSFNYPGTVKYNDYGSHWYTMNGDKYMFPGTYDFRFYTGNTIDLQKSIAISGCKFEKAPIFVQLKNSSGIGLPNSTFDYRFGYGSHTRIGTDNNGNGIWCFIEGNPGNTKVKISYKGANIERQQDVRTNPNFIFTTRPVTAELINSTNNAITSGVSYQFRYGYGSYQTFTQDMELLPVNTKIKCLYRGASVEKQQNVNSNQLFTFGTKSVTAELKNSTNNAITSGVSYQFRYGYGSYQTFTQDMELLPVNTKIKCLYRGASVEKQQNVNSNQLFTFGTKSVTAELINSANNAITSGVSYQFRYGYGSYQTFTQDMELLPVNTKIKCLYRGASVEKQQNVNNDDSFTFKTAKANPSLTRDSDDLTSDATFKYRYGYGSTMDFPDDGELLPVSTKFYCYYNNSSKEKAQTLSTARTNDVPFTWNGSSLSKQANYDIADGWDGISSESYPNPFDSEVNINYAISFESNVRIEIYDIKGQLVKTLLNENQNEGDYSVVWDGNYENGTPAESGVYVYVIQANDKRIENKISLVR
jgi:hypothetical protein